MADQVDIRRYLRRREFAAQISNGNREEVRERQAFVVVRDDDPLGRNRMIRLVFRYQRYRVLVGQYLIARLLFDRLLLGQAIVGLILSIESDDETAVERRLLSPAFFWRRRCDGLSWHGYGDWLTARGRFDPKGLCLGRYVISHDLPFDRARLLY